MVGGKSFQKSQFNLAVQGERQTGSAFKPFVLAAALDEGISPQTEFISKPTVINLGDKLWSVENYEGADRGRIDLEEATVHSDNTVYAQLTAQVGPANVAVMARRLGVTRPLHDYFAIGLGVEAVSPLEMARAFATFADGGERVDGSVLGNRPRAVLRVEDGQHVDSNDPVRRRVLSKNDAAIVTSILEGVVREGTGKRAQLVGREEAGKTGTTENYGDAWFVGYTPELAVAVWVGYPNRLKPMTNEFEGGPVAGGTYPAVIWKTFMKKALKRLDAPRRAVPGARLPERLRRPGRQPRQPSTAGQRKLRRRSRDRLLRGRGARRRRPQCKPNEVDVPQVVGSRRDLAETRLLSTPLTPELIWRPAELGEQLGRVTAQLPARGTLSSWNTVRIVLPRAVHGRIPDVVGLRLDRAREEAREAPLGRGRSGARRMRPLREWSISQVPRAGRAAAPNMTVNLVLARG